MRGGEVWRWEVDKWSKKVSKELGKRGEEAEEEVCEEESKEMRVQLIRQVR